jgi:hypothetical protein
MLLEYLLEQLNNLKCQYVLPDIIIDFKDARDYLGYIVLLSLLNLLFLNGMRSLIKAELKLLILKLLYHLKAVNSI